MRLRHSSRKIARRLDELALDLDLIAGSVWPVRIEAELGAIAVELESLAEELRPKIRRP